MPAYKGYPVSESDMRTGRMTNDAIKAGTPYSSHVLGRTAHNEITRRDSDGSVVVRLRRTDILTFKPDGTILFNTGGWNTVTTRRHMVDAFERVTGREIAIRRDSKVRGFSISFQDFSKQEGGFQNRKGGFFRERGVSKPDGTFVSDLGYVR